MKYTNYFLKTSKDSPADETARNAQLLIKAGYIRKEMAGVYSFLPLGLRVLEKIKNIVKEEMNNVGAVELLMSSLCPKENWIKTNRWDTVDVLYKMKLPNGKEVALSPTHEEIVTPMVQNFCRSYKDLPVCVYQIQTKFRNETRAKSGLLRGREFLMKDAYSFHTSEEDFEKYYQIQRKAYHKIYDRLEIGEITKYVAADGGDFGEFSHEFQTISEVGEDEIFLNPETKEYFNKEIVSEENQKKWKSVKAVEVGNIFPLAIKFSKSFNFQVTGENGKPQPIIMGCYGIGISRIMGVLAEIFADGKGIIWPKSVAPFTVYLSAIGKKDEIYDKAEEIYEKLKTQGVEVLYDDRKDKKIGPGVKFGDFELLGLPYQIVISERLIESGNIELWDRKTGEKKEIKIEEISKNLLT